jgi:hypothetical protein
VQGKGAGANYGGMCGLLQWGDVRAWVHGCKGVLGEVVR